MTDSHKNTVRTSESMQTLKGADGEMRFGKTSSVPPTSLPAPRPITQTSDDVRRTISGRLAVPDPSLGVINSNRSLLLNSGSIPRGAIFDSPASSDSVILIKNTRGEDVSVLSPAKLASQTDLSCYDLSSEAINTIESFAEEPSPYNEDYGRTLIKWLVETLYFQLCGMSVQYENIRELQAKADLMNSVSVLRSMNIWNFANSLYIFFLRKSDKKSPLSQSDYDGAWKLCIKILALFDVFMQQISPLTKGKSREDSRIVQLRIFAKIVLELKDSIEKKREEIRTDLLQQQQRENTKIAQQRLKTGTE